MDVKEFSSWQIVTKARHLFAVVGLLFGVEKT